MAREEIDIQVRMAGARKAAADAKTVGGSITGVGKAADRTDKHTRRMGKGFVVARKGIGPLRAGVTGLTGALGFGAGLGLIGAMKESINVASDQAESLSKNRVLFGKSAKAVEKFSDTSATAFGISKVGALEFTGTFGNLFHALNIGDKQSAKMSVRLTKLGADLASFNNATPEEALEAIRSGLVGETEPLRKFGVNMNDATLRAQALKLGLIDSTKDALTPQTKALAAQGLIFKQTTAAQGDFHKTSKGLANQQRILKGEVSDLEGKLGKALLPTVLKVTRATAKFVNEFRRGKGEGGQFRDQLVRIWHAAKPVVVWFGKSSAAVFKFASKHGDVVKVAVAVWAIRRALRVLRFGPAIGGLKTMWSWGSKLAKSKFGAAILKQVAGKTGLAGIMPAVGKLNLSGKFKAAGGRWGATAGKAFRAGFILALPLLADEIKSALEGDSQPKNTLKAPGHGSVPISPIQSNQDPLGIGGFLGITPKVRATEQALTVPQMVPAGAGAGGADTVIHNHFHVDGKEYTNVVTRHVNRDRNRR